METRNVEQVKIYVLVLNGVSDRCEDGSIAAVSTSHERLVEFYNNQLLPPDERYRDEIGKFRSFRDGPLHWYNPCYSLDPSEVDHNGHGVQVEWVLAESLNSLHGRYLFIEE